MEQGASQVEITKYYDYVPYINDLVEHKRKEEQFSFRQFCAKSGFKSPTYLKWVMDSERPISIKSVERFAQGLDLSKRESRYLELLVNFKEHEDPLQKRFFLEEILKRQEKKNENAFVRERYEFLSHWYFVTIRELVALPDFNEDPQWIQKKLRGTIGVWEIKHALKTLEDLELIVRDDSLRYRQNHAELHTGPEIESMAAFNYHEEILKESGGVLAQTTHKVREVSSTVSLIDHQMFKDIKKMMLEFQEKVVDYIRTKDEENPICNRKTKQELYMLNMQLLPFTQFKEEEFIGEEGESDHEDT